MTDHLLPQFCILRDRSQIKLPVRRNGVPNDASATWNQRPPSPNAQAQQNPTPSEWLGMLTAGMQLQDLQVKKAMDVLPETVKPGVAALPF